MSRQSVEEQPQTHVLTLAGDAGAPAERQLSRVPHPYPTLRGLQARAPLRPPLSELHGSGGALSGWQASGTARASTCTVAQVAGAFVQRETSAYKSGRWPQ